MWWIKECLILSRNVIKWNGHKPKWFQRGVAIFSDSSSPYDLKEIQRRFSSAFLAAKWLLEKSCFEIDTGRLDWCYLCSYWSSGYTTKQMESSVGCVVRRCSGVLQKENRPFSQRNDSSQRSHTNQSLPRIWKEAGKKMPSITDEKSRDWTCENCRLYEHDRRKWGETTKVLTYDGQYKIWDLESLSDWGLRMVSSVTW